MSTPTAEVLRSAYRNGYEAGSANRPPSSTPAGYPEITAAYGAGYADGQKVFSAGRYDELGRAIPTPLPRPDNLPTAIGRFIGQHPIVAAAGLAGAFFLWRRR